jgi:plastocyanin
MFLFKALFLSIVPVALAVDHAITIGLNNTLSFTPDQLFAAVGDTVTFTV